MDNIELKLKFLNLQFNVSLGSGGAGIGQVL